jgi:hypothetical protein
MMKPRRIETVALLAEATLEGLQRLADLPAGTPVGGVGDSQTCMENKSRSIEGAGLDHLALTETYLDRVDEVRALFERVRAVVCSSGHGQKAFGARRPGRPGGYRRRSHPRQGRRGDAGPHAPPSSAGRHVSSQDKILRRTVLTILLVRESFSLAFEQRLLAPEAPPIAAEPAVLPNHPVARNHNRDWVGSAGSRNRPRRRGPV